MTTADFDRWEARIREEFECIRWLGNRGDVDSAMLNVQPLIAEVRRLRALVEQQGAERDALREALAALSACAPDLPAYNDLIARLRALVEGT